MSNFAYCPECKEVIEAQEPCSCVFNAVGTLDAQGVLHTATPAPHCEICNSGVCDHVWEDES